MTKPEQPDQGLTFDLAVIAEELRSEPAYAREGHTARTLVRTPDLRIVLVVLRAGAEISEHHANATASVHALTGQLRLQLADRREELSAGTLLVLAAGAPHDVCAETDSSFVLTLGWPAKQ